jgi:hypothetical protein
MKIASTAARYLLGLLFTVFGLNGFLHFLPMGTVPPIAGQFLGALVQSHYMAFVFLLETVAGLLLLATSYVPLALAILAPIIVNIDFFHAFMAPAGFPLAAVVSVLWMVLAYRVRHAFLPLLKPMQAATGPETASRLPRASAAGSR